MIPPSDPQLAASNARQLMARAAASDPQAQRQVILRLSRRVQRLCKLILNDATEAEDASQHALLEILNSAGNFREPARLEQWADRIAVRVALRQRKAARRGRHIIETFREMTGSAPSVRFGEERPDLHKWLTRLSGPRREAFVLKYALGYKTEEIAELTGVPLGTVKDRLVAARKQLRRAVHFEAQKAGDRS